MTPFEKIAATYDKHPQEEPFMNYVEWHLKHGFVFSRPDFFAMGRPVIRAADPAHIKDPTHLFASEDCDCWYVHAAAGNTARMWQIMPWPLGWIAWCRLHDPSSELIFCETERLRRLCPPELSGV